MFEIRLIPKTDDDDSRTSAALPAALANGETILGRGFQGLTDPHLSRKQLTVTVDTATGQIHATRLGQNLSRLVPASTTSSTTTAKDLPKNEPTQLFHGDILYLVGMKHAYVVSIVELAPPAATNTREQPTQELGTIALAGGGPSLLSSQFGNASLLKRGGSSVSLLSVGTAGGGGGGGGGLDSHNDLDDVTGREREEEKEKRWTDDEDEDEDNTAAKTGGGSNGAVKTRVHRIDFSDESEDLNGFEDEAVDLMMDDDLSGEEDVVVRGVKTESKGGKSNKPSSRTKRNKTSLSLSSDTISFSDQSRSSPAKPGTPRFTRSRSGSITSIPIITAVERKRLVEERRLERAQSRIEANGDPMASTKTTLTQPKVKGKDTATTSRPSKRRVTAYGVYSKLERSKIKKENPTATSAEITSTLRSRFNLLKDVDRNHFHKLADEQNGNNEGVESESEDGEASSPVLNVIKTFPKKKRPLSDEGSSGSEEIPLVRIRPVRVIAASLDDAENVNNRQSASECGSPTLL